MTEFKAWPKTPRLFRGATITEKIDGTNAAVIVEKVGLVLGQEPYDPKVHGDLVSAAKVVSLDEGFFIVSAQSRKRLITPGDDNFGFAAWVYENAETLARVLGEGHHYGEWWGSGIQRGYGLEKGEKRFSLFNVNRYAALREWKDVPGLDVVPILYQGPFDTTAIKAQVLLLDTRGSKAAPGFMKPEGVIVFHEAARSVFKVLIENDEHPKGEAA